MNKKELVERLQKTKAAAELKLDEATKALAEGNMDSYTSLSAEADQLLNTAKSYREQLGRFDSLSDTNYDNPDPDKAVDRLPFAAGNDDQEPPSPVKNVNLIRYNTDDAAIVAVAQDLYGNDYQQQRADQMKAFVKYAATGRVSLPEEKLLKTLILRPDSIKQEIDQWSDLKSTKAVLQESAADLGGVLVPEDFRNELARKVAGMTAIRRYARVVQTVRSTMDWPKLEGGDDRYTSAVRVTWVDEVPSDANQSLTNPTFGMWKIPTNTVMARTDISKNQLEDTPFNLVNLISELFSEAMAIDEDIQFVIGQGGGKPHGILGDTGSGAQPYPAMGIEYVATGASSTLTGDGLIDLIYELPAQYRRNAILLGARLTHRNVRKLKDGDSTYLWNKAYAVGEPPTVLGVPFIEAESVPAVGINEHPIIYGDLKGYLIVDRVGMSFDRVEDTTTHGQNRVAFFLRRRLGGQVIEPWRIKVQRVAAS